MEVYNTETLLWWYLAHGVVMPRLFEVKYFDAQRSLDIAVA